MGIATSKEESSNNQQFRLFNDPTFSDVKIKFGQHMLHGHKAILATKSTYFRSAFNSGFAETTSKFIDLGKDDDPIAIRSLIRHIYGLSYDKLSDSVPIDTSLIFYINTFMAADKYDVPCLRDKIMEHFGLRTREMGKRLLKESEPRELLQALRMVLTLQHADTRLRSAVTGYCSKHMNFFLENKAVSEALNEENSLGGALFKILAENVARSTKYYCICGQSFNTREASQAHSDTCFWRRKVFHEGQM